MIKLYDYFRSSSAYRVRTALYMKGLDFESTSIDLVAGEQRSEDYLKINPQGAVPFLIDGDVEISQSLSALEYLDETYPEATLVRGSASDKAYIRQMSQTIACEIHPMNNPKVWKGYVGKKLGADEQKMEDWYSHWILAGFKVYEILLQQAGKAGRFSFGDEVSMADLCLIPQIYNARRFNVDLNAFPKILEIEMNCIKLEPFQKAAPEAHKDAPTDLEPIHGPNSPLLTANLSQAV